MFRIKQFQNTRVMRESVVELNLKYYINLTLSYGKIIYLSVNMILLCKTGAMSDMLVLQYFVKQEL